ncbi:MAG: PQQ-binding-like beta-propeller repeat protein, partial [Gemmataceae bacterium]
MRATLLGVLAVLAACLSAVGRGDEWPQFRGPNGSASSTDEKLPAQWWTEKNIAWKTKLPGYGWSSPIVWGDKVFLTTAVSDKQRKPSRGFGGGGGGGRSAPGGAGRFGARPQPGELVPTFLHEMLKLSEDQKKQLLELQKEVDGKVAKLLSDEQKKQLKETRANPGRRGAGGFGVAPRFGQVLPSSLRDGLKLSDDQKKQQEELQKKVDARLEKVLTAEQRKQINDMRGGFGRGRGGFGGRQRGPDAIYKLEVYCLDRASGKVLWTKLAYEGKPRIPTQSSNTYATETPVTDGERVYAYFGMHGVYCYDLAGKQLWKADLGSYSMAMGHGTGSS